jgi:hypothetical protein
VYKAISLMAETCGSIRNERYEFGCAVLIPGLSVHLCESISVKN